MPEDPRSLWKELKERKVVRVAALYAAVGWGVVLGGAELSQILELPAWVPKLVLVLAVLGFPVALVLAWAFEVTPEGVQRTEPLPSASADRPSRKPFFAGVFVGIASITLVAFLVREGPESAGQGGAALDDDLVAILPFRYSGPPEMDYLGDGVFQLLASRFTGEVGPRAADPTATAAVWDEASAASPTTAARDVAVRLGAGLSVSGSVVSGPDGLTLSATLRDVATSEDLATASAQGPPDSLTAVVERLAGGLLSLSVGEYQESLTQLTSADPAALREYLLGQVEFRHGRWHDAYDHFARAVQVDSTFALASIWMADGGNNVPGASTGAALERAWRHRDRLSERDRLYLAARLGPSYPEADTRLQRQRAYEEAARLNPDRANIWYFLGENTLHFPASRESYEQARRYFARALELDPRNANALLHLQLAELLLWDLAGAIDAAERLAGLDTTSSARRVPRWMEAVASGDTLRAVALYDSVDAWNAPALFFMDARVVMAGPWQIEPLVRSLDRLHGELIPGSSGASPYFQLYYAFQDLGRPGRAVDALAEYERAAGAVQHRMRLLDAVYGALPEGAGQVAAAAIEEELQGLEDVDWHLPADHVGQRTALELWRIAKDDLSGVDEAVALFRRLQPSHSEAFRKTLEVQALLLEAMARVRRGDAEAARSSIDAMDVLFLQGPPLGVEVYDAMVLASADTYERLGDPEKALLVLERESNFNNFRWPFGARFSRERGRLAALAGDTARAIREYEYYAIVRSDPEPALQDELDEVRRALQALR